ncbi:hypothetical protein EHS17_08160 [Rhodobacteraceae bacterium CH30]|nr:hypothetical protein EHS17_08160 [Rhodobacteraceae bacterium CH30]
MDAQNVTALEKGNALVGEPAKLRQRASELGLKPVSAWVEREQLPHERSVAAERVRRSREKAEQSGLKQLSITVPLALHPVLKTLAARTKAGEPVEAVVAELFPQLPARLPADSKVGAGAGTGVGTGTGAGFGVGAVEADWLAGLPLWRRWLLRYLLHASSRLH